MPSCNRGGGNQYAKGGGQFGPLGIGKAPRNMPIADMRRLMCDHRLQLRGTLQLKHKSGM